MIGSAIALFVFGALLLLKPQAVIKFSDFLNKIILPLEDKMRKANILSGIILITLSLAVFYLALKK